MVAGFISGVAFIGMILWLPMLFSMPTGTFLFALGYLFVGPMDAAATVAITASAIILAQCMIVGVIFGAIVSSFRSLYPENRRKSIGLGIAAGLIAFAVLYVPLSSTVYWSALTETTREFPQTQSSTIGLESYTLTVPSFDEYLVKIMAFGVAAYASFGFMLGGIVRLSYSISRFDSDNEIMEHGR